MLGTVNAVLSITGHASNALLWGNFVFIGLATLLLVAVGAPRRFWR